MGDLRGTATWAKLSPTAKRMHERRLKQDIEALTARVRSARIVTHALAGPDQTNKAQLSMADKVLIKGLAEAMTAAKKSIAAARAAPIALQQSAAELAATCAELQKQVDAMHDDIKFEATQLGNGGEASGQSSQG